jgi:hypothetical protein
LYCFLAHDRPKESTPSDALRLLKTTIEGDTGTPAAGANLGGDGEDSIETEWTALLEALVGIICWIEDGDEEMTSREEDVIQTPRFTVRN